MEHASTVVRVLILAGVLTFALMLSPDPSRSPTGLAATPDPGVPSAGFVLGEGARDTASMPERSAKGG